MEYTVTKNNNASVDLNFTFTPDEIEAAFQKAYQQAQKTANIKGFRKGKAPLDMVKRILGESVSEDAINILLSDTMKDLYPKLEHTPYSHPRFEVEKFKRNETLVAKANYETAPVAEIGEYRNIPLETYEIKVSDEEVDKEIQQIQSMLVKLQLKEESEVSAGTDMLEVDIITYPKGEDNKKEQFPKSNIRYFIGKPDNPPGMDVNFLGLRVGEEKHFEYTYPEDYANRQFAGKTFQYEINVQAISSATYPEINDELAIEWDGTQTLNELKAKIASNVQSYYANYFREKYTAIILDKIIENSHFEIPRSLILTEANNIFQDHLHRNNLPQMNLAEFAEKTGDDKEKILENLEKAASRRIKNFLCLNSISNKENISVSDEEVLEYFGKLQGEIENPGQRQSEPGNEEKARISENLQFKKIFDFLIDNSDKKLVKEISVAEANQILSSKE